jgi:hypothetical protein
MSYRDLIPETIRAIVETAFVLAKAEVLAPGAGFGMSNGMQSGPRIGI